MNRRTFVTRSGLALLGVASHAEKLMPRPLLGVKQLSTQRNRRLLFNWDGSMIQCWGRTAVPNSQAPLTRQQFISLVFTPIENSGVDTVLFSFGSGNVAEYQSNVLEWPGQADDFTFPKSKTWHGGIEVDPEDQYLNPKGMADAGHNPPAVVVEECHSRGLAAFASLRMNDCHDAHYAKGALPNPELPTFKRLHPDWLTEDLDRWTALDYRRPEVRGLKLRAIEEFFDRWDFDGIELDWLRHTLNFPRGTELDNCSCLTDFMRAVRTSLTARGAKRRRRIEIAVRVPERLDWALEGGFDVASWISEDLFDILILGQGLTELPALKEFRALMKIRQLPIYGSLYPYGNGYEIAPDEVIRANAANLWRDGVDGIYTFNWANYGTWRKELLTDLADSRRLQTKNKHYVAVHRFDAGREVGTDYVRFSTTYKNGVVPFELNSSDVPKDIIIPIADIPRFSELWLAMDHSQPGEVITIQVNGTTIQPIILPAEGAQQRVGYEINIPAGNGRLGFPTLSVADMRFAALRWQVPPSILVVGRNKVTLKVNKRAAGADNPLRVTRLEIWAPHILKRGSARTVSESS